ncbi:MAG: reverse transcriptase family protein, partial [Kiritimatiellia bacterium]
MSAFDRAAYVLRCRELCKSATFEAATLAYADHLVSQALPVIFDVRHLSVVLGIDVAALGSDASGQYKAFCIRKKGGGKRPILAPTGDLRRVQRWINETILKAVPLHEAAQGFRTGRSIVSNARAHARKEAVLNIDLKSFFHTVYQRRVHGIFKSLGYTKGVAKLLARLTTVRLPKEMELEMGDVPIFRAGMAVLPQGASTSPALANIAARGLDMRFAGYAAKHGLTYTRYADDITFSGPMDQMPATSFLVQVVKEEGFWI